MPIRKYSQVTRDDYEKWRRENRPYREKVKSDSRRLHYHLMPETGWLNDPNGLCQLDKTFHIYYQYTPFEPTGEIKLWNHVTTRDFVHYEDYGPALFPDQEFDAHGVYSGSAFLENGQLHYFYTGNVKYFDRPDYDYVLSGRGSNTVHFTSRDGFHFSPKELLMTTDDYPEDISCHVRDPKILKCGGRYYMALGARRKDDRGLVLIYRSDDLSRWEYFSRIETSLPFGYMWECPDLFFLDGELCLICCPQGVPHAGIRYANVYQCVFMRIDADFEKGIFRVKEERLLPAGDFAGTENGQDGSESRPEELPGGTPGELPGETPGGTPGELPGRAPGRILDFQSVDSGFDFYAPQSFEDEAGRRLLIGWMGIPDADYDNPTTDCGWQHALTIPRELHVRDGRLVQTPASELKALRTSRADFSSVQDFHRAVQELTRASEAASENARGCTPPDGAGSADGIYGGLSFEAIISFSRCHSMELTLRDGVFLRYEEQAQAAGGFRGNALPSDSPFKGNPARLRPEDETPSGILTLTFEKGGFGRESRSVRLSSLSSLQVFSDTTSLEIFVNGGEQVLTSRAYSGFAPLCLSGDCEASGSFFVLSPFLVAKRRPQKGLCAIGEALVDFIPEKKGLRLMDVEGFKRAAGGAPCNVAAAVSRLGLPARMLTKVGRDAFGSYLLKTMAQAGIDTSCILEDEQGETALAFVSLAADGNRDFQFYRKNSADLRYSPEDIPANALDGFGILHFCSIDLVDSPMKEAHRSLIRTAAERNVLISFDPNLRPSLWNDDETLKQTVLEFLPQAHIVKLSDEELFFLTGETDIDRALPVLLSGRTQCVIYTKGAKGADVFTKTCRASRPGLKITARDTTGAGDSFIGAFLYCILRMEQTDLSALTVSKLESILDFSNAYAAHTASFEGAIPAMTDEDGLAGWMEETFHKKGGVFLP